MKKKPPCFVPGSNNNKHLAIATPLVSQVSYIANKPRMQREGAGSFLGVAGNMSRYANGVLNTKEHLSSNNR